MIGLSFGDVQLRSEFGNILKQHGPRFVSDDQIMIEIDPKKCQKNSKSETPPAFLDSHGFSHGFPLVLPLISITPPGSQMLSGPTVSHENNAKPPHRSLASVQPPA